MYADSLYTFEDHYNDSTVFVYVPRRFQAQDSVDLIFYFHGWGNNIRKSLKNFRLTQQLEASGRNAILVFPEGPKDAPDSFGGRLEEPDYFRQLVDQVLAELELRRLIQRTQAGNICLAGHSGAYRVIAHIIERGGLDEHINEVILFDALYSELETYEQFARVSGHRLINIITPHGGTLEDSEILEHRLIKLGVPLQRLETNAPPVSELKRARVNFIYTTLGHSEVINPFFTHFLISGQ